LIHFYKRYKLYKFLFKLFFYWHWHLLWIEFLDQIVKL